MKKLNNNLTMSRLSAYVVGELQKSLHISQTMRLAIDPRVIGMNRRPDVE